MRTLLIAALVAGTGLRVCGAEEEDAAPPPPPEVSAAAEAEIVPELREPRHGGEIVVVQDHVVEVVPTAEGEVYAYLAAHDGVVPPPDDVQLTVNVQVKSGGARPVRLDWNPAVRRFEGRVEGTAPAPGPVDVLLVVDGRPRRARARRVVVVPRAEIEVVAKGAPPGARVWLHAPSGRVRVRGQGPPPHAKAKGRARVRVKGPKPPRGKARVDVRGHAPPPPHGRARVEVRGDAPRPPRAKVRVDAPAPPRPRVDVKHEVKVEGRARF
ncbi:MAG: hypothetical protein ACOC97_02915 [Myxococcota bacterium]